MRSLPTLLLLGSSLALACPSTHNSQRTTAYEESRLSESVGVFWNALRWGDIDGASLLVEDDDARVDFIHRWSMNPPYKVVDAQVLTVKVGEPLAATEMPRLRQASVTVRMEGYGITENTLQVSLVEQAWYRTAESWYLDPQSLELPE